MKRYVVGFMLNADRTRVVLIVKNRPTWQAGRLNGVGGKIEPSDASDAHAMAREFAEETGVATHPADWTPMCRIVWANDDRVDAEPSDVTFYRSIWPAELDVAGGLPHLRSLTDEQVVVRPVANVPVLPVIGNLRWLVPLAGYTGDLYEPFTVVATVAE